MCVALVAAAACSAARQPTHTELTTAAQTNDLLALSDALEVLIASGRDTANDRMYAYEVVSSRDAETAASSFARAAVTGRVVQSRGLRAANLVADVEHYARRSRTLDPTFRDGAATRLLGTLYVVAPATLLEHGDSETGLELLEELASAGPDVPENHFRLAEAYIALRDPEPAVPHLCFAVAHQTRMRPDEAALLKGMIADVGPLACPGSHGSHPASPAAGSTAPPAGR